MQELLWPPRLRLTPPSVPHTPTGSPAKAAAAKKQKQLNGPRVELAILFHSETSHPLVSWSRIALRITRTRRSRRKSIHRTTSERFPSNCVVAGRLGATIGRSPKCDIFIDDLTAANFHAQVVYVQDGYVLQTIADPDYFGTFILLGRKSFRTLLWLLWLLWLLLCLCCCRCRCFRWGLTWVGVLCTTSQLWTGIATRARACTN